MADTSTVSEARRRATEIARGAGLDEISVGQVALLATELGTNLVKHAVGGQILIRKIGDRGIELLSLDRGPGIGNIRECARDGYSTTGSPGTGLGAVARISSEYDIHSVPQKGTTVVARVLPGDALGPKSRRNSSTGVVCMPKSGEEQCGDGWAVLTLADRYLCAVVDGLGHGPLAATASAAALRCYREQAHRSPKEIVERVHDAIRSTRGAAFAVAQIHPQEKIVRYAGVGNIVGLIFDGAVSRHMVSQNGTAGSEIRRITEFTYPWSETALLVMHSDGLSTRWDLSAYPGLLGRDPSLIAGVLYRDFSRGTDDTTVVVFKES
ncbi:MAG TPA: ATP-binding SpoIIE family protein phosphatase [Candidatus Binatia bacterium]|nr:ATP-binding SpoIIE family protein phosphatase [Candidatus Binatia bacterium]